MVNYEYTNPIYPTKVGIDGIGITVRRGDIISVSEDERKSFDSNSDFKETRSEAKQRVTRIYLEEMMQRMGWRNFQRHAKREWGVSDTSKEDLVDEILESIRGGN